MKAPRSGLGSVLLLGLVLVAGCSDNNPTSPGVGLEVDNATDSFAYQVTSVQNLSTVYTYSWVNTGSAATVNQASSIAEGGVMLTIHDASGAMVYSRSLEADGTYPTGSGEPGVWTIRLAYAEASATVNFRVQKMT